MIESGNNHLLETFKSILVPIHRAGYPFIAVFALVSLLLSLLWVGFGLIGLVLTLWCIYFFRDPERIVPTRPGLVVSPGDGVIQMIMELVPPAELQLGNEVHTRISIFLNVFDVHVNRIPAAGKISHLYYVPGLFVNASLDKASIDNERQLVTIDTFDGAKIGVVQIAGLIARRIICELKDGQEVKRGERFGLIRFGSRVDIYLPKSAEILAMVGQRAIGGETILAQFNVIETKQ